MGKWVSLDEAFEVGFEAGRKACTSEQIAEIESDNDCDDRAEYLLDDMDEREVAPYDDEAATNKEIKEYEAGFIDGFFDGYKEHVPDAANDNPDDGEDEDDEPEVEEEEGK